MAREQLSKGANASLSDYNRLKISVKGLSKYELESTLRVLVRSFNVNSVVVRKSGGTNG